MMTARASTQTIPEVPQDLAAMAAAVFAVSPVHSGGIWLRASPGIERDLWMDDLRGLMAADMPLKKMPTSITEARLLGGLDLAATLSSGRPVAEAGLMAQCHNGAMIVSMAERLDPTHAALLAQTLDTHEVRAERDGVVLHHPARFGVLALDEGEGDEAPPVILTERLGICLDLRMLKFEGAAYDRHQIETARRTHSTVSLDGSIATLLCETAMALGIESLRVPLRALAVARIVAALEGATRVGKDHASIAVALVLMPRATQMPAAAEQETQPEPDNTQSDEPEASANQNEPSDPPDTSEASSSGSPPDDLQVEAMLASLPHGLLAKWAEQGARKRMKAAGRTGRFGQQGLRGRAFGSKPGDPRRGLKLALIDTLRAAAPWQALRRREQDANPRKIMVARDDFRVVRRKSKTLTTTIFVVDASGSAALQRLNEAKGAVQLLLSECYVRRDDVALIAFRSKKAELVLPPTRALARASRALVAIAGGGGTPLATGIDLAHDTAQAVLRSGRVPVVVFMTDGRANIGRDGNPGREAAMADATEAARTLATSGLTVILIDTSAKPSPQAAAIAGDMRARYLPLPDADAKRVAAVLSDGRATAQGRKAA